MPARTRTSSPGWTEREVGGERKTAQSNDGSNEHQKHWRRLIYLGRFRVNTARSGVTYLIAKWGNIPISKHLISANNITLAVSRRPFLLLQFPTLTSLLFFPVLLMILATYHWLLSSYYPAENLNCKVDEQSESIHLAFQQISELVFVLRQKLQIKVDPPVQNKSSSSLVISSTFANILPNLKVYWIGPENWPKAHRLERTSAAVNCIVVRNSPFYDLDILMSNFLLQSRCSNRNIKVCSISFAFCNAKCLILNEGSLPRIPNSCFSSFNEMNWNDTASTWRAFSRIFWDRICLMFAFLVTCDWYIVPETSCFASRTSGYTSVCDALIASTDFHSISLHLHPEPILW